MSRTPAPALFLDKDDTLIRDVPYNVDPEKIELTPGVGEALRAAQKLGYRILVITNQSGVAHGYFHLEHLPPVWQRIDSLLEEHAVQVDGYYACPHHPQGKIPEYQQECDCRKPKSGLLRQAASERHLDLPRSWMIGDLATDILAGQAAGCSTALFTYYQKQENQLQFCTPTTTLEHFSQLPHLLQTTKAYNRVWRNTHDTVNT